MQAMPALSIKDLDPKHERRLAMAAIALALLGIAWTLWRYLPGWFETGPSAAADGAPPAVASRADGERRSLDEYALFGATPGGGTDVPGELVIDAPETDLDLTLRGTLATAEPDDALAIIGDSEGNEKTYRVADELPGGAELHRVYRDRVILRRDGELETLTLREPERVAGSGGEAAAGEARAAGVGPGARPSSSDAGELARTARRLRNDPAELARNFTAVPVQEDGRLVGVRLRATGDGALLSRIGLRSSDVVTSVNGIPLNDLSRTGEIMAQLQSARDFQVTVRRDGREQQISVSLNQ